MEAGGSYGLRDDWGNITELAATAVLALPVDLLSVRKIGYNGEQSSGERVLVNPH